METIEERHKPCHLPQLTANWPAVKLWPSKEFQRLKQLVGDVEVQAMFSTTDIFYGDVNRHAPITCSMEEFLRFETTNPTSGHLYLAQAQIRGGSGLEPLEEDITIPEVIQGKDLSHVNFWMCIRGSRSSLHYDPYNNLLCCVMGKKVVHLLPPSATPYLYPMHVASDSANHSQVNFTDPDLKQHPLYRLIQDKYITYELQAGDALFIPEGWWHQVDSTGTTIGVNFWWQSTAAELLQAAGPSMSSFYMRQLLSTWVTDAVQQLMEAVQPVEGLDAADESVSSIASTLASAIAEELQDNGVEGAPELISSGADSPVRALLGDQWQLLGFDRKSTRILSSLQPMQMMNTLFILATQARTLTGTFLVSCMSPAAAQVLTNKLEQADGILTNSGTQEGQAADIKVQHLFQNRQEFYTTVYGTVEGEDQVQLILTNLTAGRQAVGSALLQALSRSTLSVANLP